MNHDLISTRYHGNLADPETERARQRIHWMCAQAAGRDVLDLGCSQGIVTLILAREGFHCTGVDVEESSLTHAREALAKEAELVRNRARFMVADATQLPFENASFDTVILGEVLEHLTQPMKVLGEARRMLRPGGRLVVTVPYGLNAYHDHKYSYYPISLLAILEPQFRTVTISTLTNYIIYSGLLDPAYDGANVSKEARFDDYLKLEKELEARCLQKERELYELGTKLYGRLKVLSAHTGNQAKELRELRDRVSSEKKLRTELEVLKTQLAEANRATEAAQKPIEVLKKQVEVLQTENNWLRTKEKQAQQLIAQRDAEWNRRQNNQRIRAFASTVLPANARVLVISKGDDELLQMDGRIGKHFPQGPGGVYAGHHPADSPEAIGHLERLRVQGAEFLLIPNSAFWWMNHYADFRRHLESQYRVTSFNEEIGLIFALRAPAIEPKEKFALTFQKEAISPATALTPAPAKETGTPATNKATTAALIGKPHPKIPGQLVVGAVMDEFTTACFGPECDLVTFRPDNWKAALETRPIDLLLVESAWRGNSGSWQYKIASFPRPMGEELVELVDHCAERKLPTIFWNKEDPAHFDRFIHRARRFHTVFTTDEDCIPRYAAELGHNRVHALPFAAQPALHNPLLTAQRSGKVCFAGTYYGDRHHERQSDMEAILKPAIPYGLEIFDRQHGMVGKNAETYRFPDIYQPCIKGRLEYDQMVQAYRRYRVFLNVNSVKDSPTMFSRRVFELMACGTPVISTYSKGIIKMLGEDHVFITESEDDTRRHLERLLGDEDTWARASVRGIRKVMLHHTYRDRLHEIFTRVGIKSSNPALPHLTVLTHVKSKSDLQRIATLLARQNLRQFDLLVRSAKRLPEAALTEAQQMLGTIKVQAIGASATEASDAVHNLGADRYLAYLDPNDYYGPNYLQDLQLAAMYSKAEFLGKHTHHAVGDESTPQLVHAGFEFQRVSSVPSATLLARVSALNSTVIDKMTLERVFKLPGKDILSLDRFNYLPSPRGPSGAAKLAKTFELHSEKVTA